MSSPYIFDIETIEEYNIDGIVLVGLNRLNHRQFLTQGDAVLKVKSQRFFKNFFLGSIRSRFIFSMAIIICIVVSLVLFSSIDTVTTITRDRATESISMMMDQASYQIDSIFKNIEKLMYIMSNDYQIQEALKQETEVDNTIKNDVNTKIMYLTNASSYYVQGAYIVAENGEVFKSACNFLKTQDFRNSDWYLKIFGSDSTVFFDKHRGSFIDKNEDLYFITMGKTIKDYQSGKTLGVILVDIYYNAIYNVLSKYLLVVGGAGYFLNYNLNQILDLGYGEISDDMKKIIKDRLTYGEKGYYESIDGNEYYIHNNTLANNLCYVSIVPVEKLAKGGKEVRKSTLIAAAFALVLGIAAAYILASMMTRPISRLCYLMTEVENGNFNVFFKTSRKDELGRLGISFNHMIKRIAKLIEEVQIGQTRLREAQIRIYQEQIKPHFLYNTMDSIRWLIRMKKTYQAENTIKALTKLFRIGLSDGSSIISIKKEIEYLENYLVIQKTRYCKKFEYKINIQKEIEDLYTVKLILQPIVENSIYHGFKKMEEKGIISVDVKRINDHIVFQIEDNGVGISKDKLDRINQILSENNTDVSVGFGIENINERLRIIYHNKYRMIFDSLEGKGTIVKIYIPIIEEMDQYA